MKPQVVVLGNLIVDDVVYSDGTTCLGQPGGAALYVALGAAVWGARVGLVSIVGEDYPAEVLDRLGSRGIAVDGVRKVSGPGLRTWLLYEGRRRRVVHRLDVPSHAAMSPGVADVPAGWEPSAIHLAPMPVAVQRTILEELSGSTATLSVDPYELVDEGSLAECRELFGLADIALLSEDELLLARALDDPRTALTLLAEAGARTGDRLTRLVLKRGARGGLTLDRRTAEFTEWQPLDCDSVDPTGAGDAFAGGLLAGLAAGLPFEQALARGVVSATLALGAPGAAGLFDASLEDCTARLPAAAREAIA